MNEQLDRVAARARAAVDEVAERHADPDGDLAAVLGDVPVEAIDPLPAVLTIDPATGARGLVPLD